MGNHGRPLANLEIPPSSCCLHFGSPRSGSCSLGPATLAKCTFALPDNRGECRSHDYSDCVAHHDRRRLELAAQDIQRLQRPDGDVATLLRRFATELARYDSAGTRADLLKRYGTSDLAAADLPVSMAAWTPSGERIAELRLAPVVYDSALVARLVLLARDSAQPVILQTSGEWPAGYHGVGASSGNFTSAVASPRTQLIAPDPFVSLLGFSPPMRAEPPYTLTISDVTPDTTIRGTAIQWRRIGNEIHGDRLVQTSRGVQRAHAEVDLRSVAARGEGQF